MIQENKTASATPLLFCLLFVLFSSVILGDNIAESLLISNFDPSILPVMFIVNSIFLLLFSLFFINLIDRVDRGRFMLAVLAVHACCLLGIRVLISLKIPFIFPIIYSYSYASKMMIFILFWTIANDITDARKAKETFPIIAGGGVAGGVLISYSVVFLIRIIPAEDLLFVWAGLLVAATPLVLVIYRRYFSMLKSSTRLPGTDGVLAQISENYQLVRSEPLLKSMAAIYFLSFILLFAQDYLFLSTLKQTFIAGKAYFVKGHTHALAISAFAGADVDTLILKKEIPRFLGIFKGTSNLITFLIQFTVAGLILKKMGTARSTLIMPIIFIISYGAMLCIHLSVVHTEGLGFYPLFGNLLFAVIMGGVALRIAAFDSIYSPNFQIFFSTLKKEIRGRGKLFIEGIIKPFAITSSGLLIIILYQRSILVSITVLFIMSCALLFLCLRIRQGDFPSIFEAPGGDRSQKISQLLGMRMEQADESMLDIAAEVADDPEPGVADFAVSLMARVRGDVAILRLKQVFERAPESRKAAIVALLGNERATRFVPIFQQGLKSNAAPVVARSIEALRRANALAGSELSALLDHPDNAVRVQAIVAHWGNAGSTSQERCREILGKLLVSGDAEAIRLAVHAAAEIKEPSVIGAVYDTLSSMPLATLKKDPVRFNDMLMSMVDMGNELSVSLLIGYLSSAGHHQTRIIEEGLAGPLSRDAALAEKLLRHPQYRIKRSAARALLINKAALLPEIRRIAGELVETEIHALYGWAQYSWILRSANMGDETAMLADALFDSLVRRNLEFIVNLLRMLDPGDLLLSVPGKVTSRDKNVRSRALELIENNVKTRYARLFLPLCEEEDLGRLVETGRSIWHFTDPGMYFVLGEVAVSGDPWLRAFGLYTAIVVSRKTGDPRALATFPAGDLEKAKQKLEELVYGT